MGAPTGVRDAAAAYCSLVEHSDETMCFQQRVVMGPRATDCSRGGRHSGRGHLGIWAASAGDRQAQRHAAPSPDSDGTGTRPERYAPNRVDDSTAGQLARRARQQPPVLGGRSPPSQPHGEPQLRLPGRLAAADGGLLEFPRPVMQHSLRRRDKATAVGADFTFVAQDGSVPRLDDLRGPAGRLPRAPESTALRGCDPSQKPGRKARSSPPSATLRVGWRDSNSDLFVPNSTTWAFVWLPLSTVFDHCSSECLSSRSN